MIRAVRVSMRFTHNAPVTNGAVSMRFTHTALVMNRAVPMPLTSPQISKRKGKKWMEAFAKCYACRMRWGDGGGGEEGGSGWMGDGGCGGSAVGEGGWGGERKKGGQYSRKWARGLQTCATARFSASSFLLVAGKKTMLSMVWMSSSCTTQRISSPWNNCWSEAWISETTQKQDPAVKGTELLKAPLVWEVNSWQKRKEKVHFVFQLW